MDRPAKRWPESDSDNSRVLLRLVAEPTRGAIVQLSQNAAMALKAIRENEEIPEDHDTRLAADQQDSGDLAVRLEFVEETQDDDEMTEQSGTEVYLDSRLAQPLADTTMDVQQTDEGLAFVFRAETV